MNVRNARLRESSLALNASPFIISAYLCTSRPMQIRTVQSPVTYAIALILFAAHEISLGSRRTGLIPEIVG
jgi:hypothetical protein